LQIDKIDINFYRRSSRVNIDEETRINASKENIDAQADDDSMSGNEPPNFITNLFFLANAFQHLGLIKTISTRKRAEKNISEIEKELKRAEASRPSWEGVSHCRMFSTDSP
jgi:ubiquitin conjugation factor E4 B